MGKINWDDADITIKHGKPTDEDIERLRVLFREAYRGPALAGRIITIPAGVDIVFADEKLANDDCDTPAIVRKEADHV